MRSLPVLLLVLAASPVSAQRGTVPSGCQEDYATCKEDCSIEYGGSGRTLKKLTQCLSICTENREECSDRHSAIRGLPSGVVADEPRRPSRRPGKPVNREEDPFGDANSSSEPRRTTNREEDPFGDARPERPPGPRGAYRSPDEIPAEDTSPPKEPTPAPLDTSPPPPPVSRQGVYRASDSEPKPAPEPSADIPDDLEPLDAPPAPTPTAATRPSPRSEPARTEAPAAPRTEEKKDPLLDDEPAPPPAPTAKKAPPPAPAAPPRPKPPPDPKYDISEWDPNGD
ncbi:hypothetical protein [Myxococcus sp. AS-1-15]|jgi:hypothetical protein|uniref:hypothetical protein n=1 Tax=Myxococcus sp. AS-1-15 TaxID=2874600 RepID=UPI001CBC4C6C|nr:hypothetical protein [Myxococcus sp. AS-1-15]MBZ4394418.1 hypothetical protein [Myxococcus sp. AS-1-15]